MGGGDLAHVLGDLDLGEDGAVGLLNGAELVHAAEDGVALGGDEALTHTEGIHLGALADQLADDVLIQGVRDHDLTVEPARLVQHTAHLLGEVGDIARVQTNGALGDAQGLQNLLKGLNGVGHARLQDVVGVHQEGGVVGVELAVVAEGGELIVEHLHPGVGHGAGGGHTVQLVGDGAGGVVHATDVGGAGTQDGGVCALGAAGTELGDHASLGGAGEAGGLGGDEGFVVDDHEDVGLDELGLNGGGADDHEGLAGEDIGALGDGPDIPREAEGAEVVQESLVKEVLTTQVGDIVLVKVEVLDVLHDLLKACHHGVSAAVGVLAVEHVEVHDLIGQTRLEVAVGHGQLVEVAEHGEVAGDVFHGQKPSFRQAFHMVVAQDGAFSWVYYTPFSPPCQGKTGFSAVPWGFSRYLCIGYGFGKGFLWRMTATVRAIKKTAHGM